MKHRLQIVNLVGVCALAVLSAFQWESNRGLNLTILDLRKAQQQLEGKFSEREQKIKDATADLDTSRERVAQLDAALKEAQGKLAGQSNTEQAQSKQNTTEWTAAIAARDEQIKTGNEQIKSVVTERNAAISKFNDLAAKFNATVKDLNEARARLASRKGTGNAGAN